MSGNTVNTSIQNWQTWQNSFYANLAQNPNMNFGTYNTPIFGFGNYNASSNSSTEPSTYSYESQEDYKKKFADKRSKKKENAQAIKDYKNKEIDITDMSKELGINVNNVKTSENSDGVEVSTAKVSDVEKALKIQQKNLKTARKKKDGTFVINQSKSEYKKNTPWWKRTLRSIGNMVQGPLNLAAKFAGFEDGMSLKNWNWKKCLKNVGIALGAVALCAIPGVGPVISTALLVSGVAAGAFGVTKGIVKATKAQTVEDMDRAFQDIGSGAFIGVTSAVGLRGVGRSVSGVTSPTSTGIGSKIANFFKEFKPSNMKQSFTDMTVNAFKATKADVALGKTAIQNNGFWSTFGSNLKNSFVKPTQDLYNNAKQTIKTKYQNTRTSLSQAKNSVKNTFTKYSKKSNWSWSMLYKVPLKLVWGALKGTWKTGKFAVKIAFNVTSLPLKPWAHISKTPGGTTYTIQEAINPQYETFMFAQTCSKEELTTQKEQIAQYLKELQEQSQQLASETSASEIAVA